MSKIQYLGPATLVGVFLLGPFTLRTISSQLEVYPSIVLPSGAYLANSDSATITTTKLEGLGLEAQSHEEITLDLKQLFAPLPIHYIPKFINNGLGLSTDASVPLKLKYIPRPFRPANLRLPLKAVTASEAEEVKTMLRERLTQAGCSPDKLIIRKREIFVDKLSREISEGTIIYEEAVNLAR